MKSSDKNSHEAPVEWPAYDAEEAEAKLRAKSGQSSMPLAFYRAPNLARKTELPNFEIDTIRPDEVNLVVSDWSRSYEKRFRELYPKCPDKVYYAAMQRFIGAVAGESAILMARSVDGDAQPALGWICFRPKQPGDAHLAVFYCYVKDAVRQLGLAKALLEAAGLLEGNVILTAARWNAPKFMRRKYNVFWNPTLMWKGN